MWKLCWLMCCANVRICFTPIPSSGLNSIQIVPVAGGGGLGLDGVGKVVYFWIIASVGRAENVIFLRLPGIHVSPWMRGGR